MTISARGRAVLDHVHGLSARTAWDWRRCPCCGGTHTHRWGSATPHPWTLSGRPAQARVPGHRAAVPTRRAARLARMACGRSGGAARRRWCCPGTPGSSSADGQRAGGRLPAGPRPAGALPARPSRRAGRAGGAMRRWSPRAPTTSASSGSDRSGAGAPSGDAAAADGITAPTTVGRGRPWCGRSIAPSRPPMGGPTANVTTAVPASVPLRWPASHPAP